MSLTSYLQSKNPKQSNSQPINSTEPLVGYRVWKIDRERGRLFSVTNGTPWPFRRRLVKDEIQAAGIHAARAGSQAVELWSTYGADVAGSVYLWGEVKEHTEGFLAEFAYPKELWMPENTDPLTILMLEENYGVPVTLRPEFQRSRQNQMQAQMQQYATAQQSFISALAQAGRIYWHPISAYANQSSALGSNLGPIPPNGY